MLDLIGQTEIAQKLIQVREALMEAVRLNKTLVPEKHLPLDLLYKAIEEYSAVIPD